VQFGGDPRKERADSLQARIIGQMRVVRSVFKARQRDAQARCNFQERLCEGGPGERIFEGRTRSTHR